MLIQATKCRLSEADAGNIALKERKGLLGVLFEHLSRQTGTVSIEKTFLFYYPFYYGGALLRFKRIAMLPDRDMAGTAVMEGVFGFVTAMLGTPELFETNAEPEQVVKCQFPAEEARERIALYLQKRGAGKYKNIPNVEFFEFYQLYKPHYMFMCKKNNKSFTRIVDGETGERNYRLEVVYKDFKFEKE